MKRIIAILLTLISVQSYSQGIPHIYTDNRVFDGSLSLPSVAIRPISYPSDSTRAWTYVSLDSAKLFVWDVVNRMWREKGLTILANSGTGFRVANTTTNTLKTLFSDNSLTLDSTTNAGLTYKLNPANTNTFTAPQQITYPGSISNGQLKLGSNGAALTNFCTDGSGNLTIYPAGYAMTLEANVSLAGYFSTTPTAANANLWVLGQNNAQATTQAENQFNGSSSVYAHIVERGSALAQPPVGINYSSHIIGTHTVQSGTNSGTSHFGFGQLVINPLSISLQASPVTNSWGVYVPSAATGATNNYTGWFGTGRFRVDGTTELYGKLTEAPSTSSSSGGNIPTGVAPASPLEGDYWVYNHHYYMRLNGVSQQLDQQSGGAPATDTSLIHAQLVQLQTVQLTKFDSLRNNAGVLEGRKNGIFVPQFTLPANSGITDTSNLHKQDSINAAKIVANTSSITSIQSAILNFPDSIRRTGTNWQYRKNGNWITYGTDSVGTSGGVGGSTNQINYNSQLVANPYNTTSTDYYVAIASASIVNLYGSAAAGKLLLIENDGSATTSLTPAAGETLIYQGTSVSAYNLGVGKAAWLIATGSGWKVLSMQN